MSNYFTLAHMLEKILSDFIREVLSHKSHYVLKTTFTYLVLQLRPEPGNILCTATTSRRLTQLGQRERDQRDKDKRLS